MTQSQGSGRARSLAMILLVAVTTSIASVASDGVFRAERAAAGPSLPVALEDFAALTDDNASVAVPGCDAITLLDSSTGEVVTRGGYRMSPGQLALSSDASLILALYTNNGQFINVMKWQPREGEWKNGWIDDPALAWGAIAVSPDDGDVLVAGFNQLLKYRVADVTLEGLGPVAGSATFDPRRDHRMSLTTPIAAAIEFTADSRTAYVVVDDGYIYTLDVDSMSWRDAPLAYAVTEVSKIDRTRHTFASLSPDEQWLVVNTGAQSNGRLNVVDLAQQEVSLVKPEGVAESWGVAFNYTGLNRGLLAVHGRSAVGVYDFSGGGLRLIVADDVPPSRPRTEYPSYTWSRGAALSWTGDGARLIVRRGAGGLKEWRLLELTGEQPRQLKYIVDFDSCTATNSSAELYLEGFDVVTLQDRLHRPTLTPSPEATPSPTPSPIATPSPSASLTPTRASPTSTATHTSSPTATPSPSALYLPLALRERCNPEYQRSDIALVVDTSSSMTGQKIEDARGAALTFVGLIDLEPGRGQVAVVRFDREAEVVRELTRSRALIEAAVRNLHVRSGTDIDKGLRTALAELQSPRHLERNAQVLILLTDGVQTGTPGEELRAGEEVRAAGVRVYTIGLGADVDEATLRDIAGADERYYFAPDSGDLARIYGEIARDLMCPGVEFWGQR